MRIAWHSSRWWGWCLDEDKKRDRKIVGMNIWFFVPSDRIQKIF